MPDDSAAAGEGGGGGGSGGGGRGDRAVGDGFSGKLDLRTVVTLLE